MYRNNKPVCNEVDSESKNEKISKIEEGSKYDPYVTRIIYEDGSSTYYWGGPCGSTSYDEFGEEC